MSEKDSQSVDRLLPRIAVLRYFLRIFIVSSFLFLPGTGDMANAEERFYSIQLGSFKDLQHAEEMVNGLKKLNHNAFYRQESVEGKGNFYKVYIEKYGSKKEAQDEAKILRELGLISEYSVKAIEEKARADSRKEESRENGNILLHVGSFKEKSNAERNVEMLNKQGCKAFFKEEAVSGTSFFRVYAGKFNDEAEARRAGAGLKEKGIIPYFKPIKVHE